MTKSDSGLDGPLLPYLVACVTFFFVPERLPYLTKVLSNYIDLARKLDIHVITNVADGNSRKMISDALRGMPSHVSIQFVTPNGIGHPYLLPWAHRDVFWQTLRLTDATHFLYTEDDLNCTRENILYWLNNRQRLRPFGLIPSFFRVELHPKKGWCSTDIRTPVCLDFQPKLKLDDETLFTCMPNPYQGMYFFDRELMKEYSSSPAISPDFGNWAIRETATAGLTFVNIPEGFTSRNVVPFSRRTQTVDQQCWVQHLPNNYANDPHSAFGKIPMQAQGLFVSPARLLKFRIDRYLKKSKFYSKFIKK